MNTGPGCRFIEPPGSKWFSQTQRQGQHFSSALTEQYVIIKKIVFSVINGN